MPFRDRARVSTQVTSWLPARGFTSPLQFGPTLWFDAADTSSLTVANGTVSQWNDKSGNGYHVTQGTAASQPASGASTQNGLNIVDFNNDFLYRNQQIVSTNNSLFVVAKFFNNTTRYAVLDLGVSTSLNHLTIEQNTFNTVGQRYGFYAASGNNYDSSIATSSGMKLFSVDFSVSGGTNVANNTTYRVNNSVATLTLRAGTGNWASNWADTVNGFMLGGFNGVTSVILPLNGSIAEVVFFRRVLTSEETSLMTGYLNSKWAIY